MNFKKWHNKFIVNILSQVQVLDANRKG